MKAVVMLQTVDRPIREGKAPVRLQEGREYQIEDAELAHGLVADGLAVYAGGLIKPKAKSKPANKAVARSEENKDVLEAGDSTGD